MSSKIKRTLVCLENESVERLRKIRPYKKSQYINHALKNHWKNVDKAIDILEYYRISIDEIKDSPPVMFGNESIVWAISVVKKELEFGGVDEKQ